MAAIRPQPMARETRPISETAARLGAALDRMIALQMTAYPDDWSADDRREMAERDLFGRAS